MRNQSATFCNPLYQGQDPWIIQKDGYYYSSYSGLESPNSIYVCRSRSLLDRGPKVKVFDGAGKFIHLFSPELHYIDGEWYIYAASFNFDYNKRYLFVWKGKTQNPLDGFELVNCIIPKVDGVEYEANDTTVFRSALNGKLYMIMDVIGAHECMAEMKSPTELKGEFVHMPMFNGEGPRVIQRDGMTIVTNAWGFWRYSSYCVTAADTRSDDYFNPDVWTSMGYVFKPHGTWANEQDNARVLGSWDEGLADKKFIPSGTMWGTSRASFVKSADGTEDWMFYHHKVWSVDENGYRQISMQKFTFNEDGTPNFGSPVQTNEQLPIPSGDPGLGEAYSAAEAAPFNGAQVAAEQTGAIQSQYVNLAKPGQGAAFGVNAKQAGKHIATLRYSYGHFVEIEQSYNWHRNDPATARLSVYVNGEKQTEFLLQKTKDYDQWMQDAVYLNLKEGENQVEIRLNPGREGHVALDTLWIAEDLD